MFSTSSRPFLLLVSMVTIRHAQRLCERKTLSLQCAKIPPPQTDTLSLSLSLSLLLPPLSLASHLSPFVLTCCSPSQPTSTILLFSFLFSPQPHVHSFPPTPTPPLSLPLSLSPSLSISACSRYDLG